MQRGITKSFLLLFVTILSANFYPSRCSPFVDFESESCDSDYEENKQELADEIDDVNEYMQMVEDQLTKDGVIVVRAVTTRFTAPDIENMLKPDTSYLGEGDPVYDQPKETISSTKSNTESLCEDQNVSSIDTKLKEIQEIGFEMEKSPVNIRDSETNRSKEAEIISQR